ncbi:MULTISPECIES: hypothetical protein [unclassified Synechocystis]|uniref:hypothetical protein n=1 Tax=unclassified Synechocystis TaxID=2640012 RepID=UPI0002A57BB7|nr:MULTISPECIES: hypothetical protein [unclassified Synechocystis]MBD2638561.1 hypothetical protein [Synechocystis sp. FACHB-908]BAM50625.1 hypothetical protein BEST7613_1694 [Synechocystis sp. PCC 6803] [Bacillus subtilis BEST7613]ALJ66680.1 hypothetical protein AOY38_01740 [Synechocystis sp. PCC 6803]AVP88523.1 hypothetical protein C7I86_01760 [Synechocystis sp. IPPAS B-1465]MCW5239931.1 hypothetical protein [Synechocystis sp. PCC 6803]
MYAIEFEADLQDGVLTIPDHYKSLKNQHVRVVIMLDGHGNELELRALSDHSATLIDEWHDPSEDDVWI